MRGPYHDQSRLALGEGAGLVHHDRIDLLHALQHVGRADEYASRCTAADADHDRHRRGQPERTGQAMMSTATALTTAKCRIGAKTNQTTKVMTATSTTAGTNHPATRSASFCTGARLRWACRDQRDDPRKHRLRADLRGRHQE